MKTANRMYHQVARAESSRELRLRILQAFMNQLLRHWIDEVTLDNVAAESRTTRQTVIRMFGDKSGLIRAVLEVWPAEIEARRRLPAGSTPEEIATSTVTDLEILGNMFLGVLAMAPRHPVLREMIEVGRRNHRLWVGEALEPTLSKLKPQEAERVLCECLVATDTYTWALLRRDHGKDVTETVAIITDMLRKALGMPASKGPV